MPQTTAVRLTLALIGHLLSAFIAHSKNWPETGGISLRCRYCPTLCECQINQ
jgi:hypothetical protein